MKPYKWVTREEMLKNGFTLDGEENAPDYEDESPLGKKQDEEPSES